MHCNPFRVSYSAKFGTCTVVSVNGTLVEDKMRSIKGEFENFSFNKCPIYTHDGASAKFNTNSHETDNVVTSRLGIANLFHSVGGLRRTNLDLNAVKRVSSSGPCTCVGGR